MIRRIATLLIVIVLAGAAWMLRDRFQQPLDISDLSMTLADIEERISAPAPLRGTEDSPMAFLTRAGIVEWTNTARGDEGLPGLSPDFDLNAAALAKVRDMFERQYFAHISPSGEGAADLAAREGYQYISIGENLALGNFENDEDLVRAWLDSPGHRANIMSDKFTEIGAAAEQGIFEGKRVWLAVQIFALPRSACPNVDESLENRITANQELLDEWQNELEKLRADIDRYEPKRGEEYSGKVELYNAKVQEYNLLLKQTKFLIDQYNDQVKDFNLCLNS